MTLNRGTPMINVRLRAKRRKGIKTRERKRNKGVYPLTRGGFNREQYF